jgi:diguanylate cyclase (GGDEF)-like protein/PAS domain S-box-containing protein
MSTDDTVKPQVTQLREAAEAQLGNTPQHEFAARPAEKLQHELQVHQIELEMQNDALRQAQLAQEKQNEALHKAQLALADSLDRYVDLYEFAPVGYLTLTPDGIISEINLTATTLLGRERKNMLNRNLRTFFMPEDQYRWDRHLLTVKKQDAQGRVELAMQRGDGAMFHAQLDCLTIKSVVRITLLDITRRKLAEDELRIAAVAFASQNGIMITDPKAVIQRVNPAFTQLTGYSAEEAIGKTPAMLHSGRQGPLFYLEMNVALKEKGYWQGEIWNRRKNGIVYAELLTITVIYSPAKSVTHFVGSFTDITDIKEAEAEIHRLAYFDPLTKLPNRRLLQDRLKQSIAATARSKMYGALFFIDLDRFKALNDTRGHDVGDLLLINVGQRLLEAVRKNDTVARQGGDEFVLLMQELGATANEAAVLAEQLGNKVHAALNTPFNLNGYEYHCSSSIGVDLFYAHDTVESLLKHADLALYQAKNSGRGKLRFFNPALQDAIDQRSILESALQKVLPLNQLRLYYQPQLDASRRVVGVEALLRWQHPQRGLVAPDEFIPLAEDSGLILPIGRWVMETACAQIKVWESDAHTCELQIAVNVSARQFRQPDFVMQVKNVLVDSGANPVCLKLELTESMLLEDVKDTIAKMQAIKQLGVRFSMDDFGTGYSSLSYLAQLPLDQIKVDKAFVRNLPGVTKDETIAKAIITLGLGLNMNVIAEGVETESQREFLEAHGCHEYQGYLFSRPLTIEALEIFLQRK